MSRKTKHSNSDISESELDDYIDDVYYRLKKDKYKVKVSMGTFRCPFCVGKEKQDYSFHDLLDHARAVGKGPSRDGVKLKGKHKALAYFLDKYHRPRVSSGSSGKGTSQVKRYDKCSPRVSAASSGKGISEVKHDDKCSPRVSSVSSGKGTSTMKHNDKYSPRVSSIPSGRSISQANDHEDTEKFVWPWKGIVANLPVELKNGRYVGESGSKLREELAKKGFNPLKVNPLWSPQGHSGFAIVNFGKDLLEFKNARSFENDFELNRQGRRDWYSTRARGDKLFGWVAREEDYISNSLFGKHLRDNGDLKTFADIKNEEERKRKSLFSSLNQTIQLKDKQEIEMQSKLNETCAALEEVMKETDKMTQSYNEEMERMWKQTVDDKKKILSDHDNSMRKLRSQKDELEKHEKLLEKREADYDNKIIKLRQQRKLNEMATREQHRSEQKVLRLVEEHEREKEALHKKIIDLEKQIDQKQALELQIEQLKGAAQVMEHMGRDAETKKMMEEINEELKEKEDELEDIEALTQALVVKEKKCNDELQDARKELIMGLKERKAVRANIGVKIMGLLDMKVFEIVAKEKYSKKEAATKAEELFSLCKGYIADSEWHPFKVVSECGVSKEVINEEDERLKNLRNEHGEKVWQAVTTVMSELNEYNPSGRNQVPELWNLKDNRKASLGEGAEYLVNLWRSHKKKR